MYSIRLFVAFLHHLPLDVPSPSVCISHWQSTVAMKKHGTPLSSKNRFTRMKLPFPIHHSWVLNGSRWIHIGNNLIVLYVWFLRGAPSGWFLVNLAWKCQYCVEVTYSQCVQSAVAIVPLFPWWGNVTGSKSAWIVSCVTQTVMKNIKRIISIQNRCATGLFPHTPDSLNPGVVETYT